MKLKRNASNQKKTSDQRLHFKMIMLLVKQYFSFGLWKVSGDKGHVYQTSDAAILNYYLPAKSLNIRQNPARRGEVCASTTNIFTTVHVLPWKRVQHHLDFRTHKNFTLQRTRYLTTIRVDPVSETSLSMELVPEISLSMEISFQVSQDQWFLPQDSNQELDIIFETDILVETINEFLVETINESSTGSWHSIGTSNSIVSFAFSKGQLLESESYPVSTPSPPHVSTPDQPLDLTMENTNYCVPRKQHLFWKKYSLNLKM
ncbi:hypothetical protein HNY73_010532 [Argiope bruennichi]|uniref:Uncharacterized protein n=1 Tax=Argiope bruennichi TaxID=94029 RepID=A0A8T0F3R8_ARGBR|nr:hypothetical protein HNY73_010532 [Argiope bruennichi]